jgi:hypothetical protein
MLTVCRKRVVPTVLVFNLQKNKWDLIGYYGDLKYFLF